MKKSTLFYGSSLVAYTFVVIGLVALINYTSFNHYKRYDYTKQGRHSLSSHTVKLLERLPYEINTILFVKNNPAARDKPEGVLKQYSYHGAKFKWRFVDPDKKPDLAKKYGVTQYNTYVVEGRKGKVQKFSGRFTEGKLTNAIIKIISTKEKVLYFTKGHGEKNMFGTDVTGYSSIRAELKKENYKVEELMLFTMAQVPEDATVLIVAGPEKDLPDTELKKIEEFLFKGGKVFWLLDPLFLDSTIEFVSKFGIRLTNDIIVDRTSKMFGGDDLIPTVANYAPHEITREFKLMTFFPVATSMVLSDDGSIGVRVSSLAKTLPPTWGETSREELEGGEVEFNPDRDHKGPLDIAAVVELKNRRKAGEKLDEEEKERVPVGALVVVGDSDFVTNSYLRLSGNTDFFMNIVSWLAEEEDRIAIRAKEVAMDPIRFTMPQLYTIAGISVVGLPGVVLITGIWINLRRRRA